MKNYIKYIGCLLVFSFALSLNVNAKKHSYPIVKLTKHIYLGMSKQQARKEGRHIPRRKCQYSYFSGSPDMLWFSYEMSTFKNNRLVTAVFRTSEDSFIREYRVDNNSHNPDEIKAKYAVPRILKGAQKYFKDKNVKCNIEWYSDPVYDKAHIFLYLSYKNKNRDV